MLSLDPTTRAEYDAAETPSARAAAVLAAITGTVTATVYDGSGNVRGSGTMESPWATIVGSRLIIGEVSNFLVTSGGTPDADWKLAFETAPGWLDSRWLSGPFGLTGDAWADFTWSLPTFATGQSGRMGTVEAQAKGYEPVSQDETAQWDVLTFAQASFSSSWAVADGSAQALDADAVPSPIQIYQGQTFDFADYIVGGVPPYSVALGSGSSLPLGVAKTGPTTLYAAVDAPTTEGTPIELLPEVTFDIDDSAPSVTLPTFGVLSHVGGADLPFAAAHVFKQGDVPSGSFVDSNLTDWQCTPVTRWPDGSLKHAIIAGRATCTQNVRKDIALSVSATDRTGTALTEANLLAALTAGQNTLEAGSGGQLIDIRSLVGTAALHKTVCAGPVMSNWIYRTAITGSTTLVAWFDVRLYLGGRVEIFPWIENGFLTGDAPANDTRTWTLTVGGSQRFSQSVTVVYRTRIPLLNAAHTSFAHWSSDPGIVPVHNAAYLRASRMVPNYGWTAPSEATLNGLTQAYTPNMLAGVPSSMGTAGGSAAILPLPQALYCTSADVRAYRAAVVFGLSGGSWSVHLRDSDYGHEPFAFVNRPNVSDQSGSPATPAGTGATNGTAVTTHQPSYGYLPWLVTGRWWFLDESLFWTNWNYWKANTDQRRGLAYAQNQSLYPAYAASASAGICDSTNGTYVPRGAAWSLRTLAQSLAIVPASHPCYASLKASWEANCGFYHAMYVTGTHDRGYGEPSRAGSALGFMGEYGNPYGNATYWGGAGWMYGMVNQVWGFTKDLDLPQTTGTEHDAVVAHAMKWSIGCAGGASGWNYRRFTTYGAVIGNGTTLALHPDFATALSAHEAFYSLGSLDASAGLSLKQHSSNTDLISASSSWPYFGQQFAALAYATEFGLPGASDGWARVTGAQNFAATATQFNQDPVYGIVPRSA